ncbi:hypothetical protein JXI42_11180 [bacterium]|nr:hypothetical protein [bacterium]
MYNDPIVKEIHKYREEHAAKFDFDLTKIVEYYKTAQTKNKDKLVNFIDNKQDLAKT